MKLFRPVKNKKISERIAQQIKKAIFEGIIKPGDRLPPERELVERFQASRISVREALKALETSGLITIKPGSGVFVNETNSRPMSESLSSILRIRKISMNELTEARMIVEPSIAKLACERIGAEKLQELEQNINEALAILKSNISARVKNIEFHSLLAESTQNVVLALMMKTMLDVLNEMSSKVINNSPKNVEMASHTVRYHQKILKALREKDAKKVYDLMEKHIRQVQGSLKKIEVGRH